MRLTAIITAHAEDLLLRPTLRSVSAALERVAAAGESCELLIQLDGASEGTRRQAEAWRDREGLSFAVRVEESTTGDAGSARNEGVARSRGEFVVLCDGDDLMSSDFLVDALRAASAVRVPTVFHPETIITFGDRPSRWRVLPSTLPGLNYRELFAMNRWPSCSFALRELFEAYPHPKFPPAEGFGPEDWTWNLQTVAAGIEHEVVERSVFFYRTRATGGVNQQHAASLLPPTIDLTALRARFPLADPGPRIGGLRRVVRGGLRRARAVVMPRLRRLPSPVKRVMIRSYQLFQRRTRPVDAHVPWRVWRWNSRTRPVDAHVPWRSADELRPYFVEAAAMEPALSWNLTRYDELDAWIPRDDGFGAAIDAMLLGLEGHADALVMVPWIGIGGADLVSQNYLRALAGDARFGGKVAALATYLPDRTLPEMIPDGVAFVQADQALRMLAPERQEQVFAQLVVWARPRLVVGVNCFDLVTALRRFHSPLCRGRSVYLSLFAFDEVGAGFPVQPITDDPQRAFLSSITGIVTDNVVTKRRVDEMLGLPEGFLTVHPQPALERTMEVVQQSTGAIVRLLADSEEAPPPTLRRYTAAHDDRDFDAAHPFRLLWPHRLDDEKRPDALLGIADEAAARGVPIAIDVYGSYVLSADGGELLKQFARRGIQYRGPYAGGLVTLPTSEYHAMLLTSAWEGMPLVVVQSMMLGLPVIATAVGGIPDLIVDGESGMLTTGPEDAAGFVDAVERLLADRELRRSMIVAAYDAAVERHSWRPFRELVATQLRLPEGPGAMPSAAPG